MKTLRWVYTLLILTFAFFNLSVSTAHASGMPIYVETSEEKQSAPTSIPVTFSYLLNQYGKGGDLQWARELLGAVQGVPFPIVTGNHCEEVLPDGGHRELVFLMKMGLLNTLVETDPNTGEPQAELYYGPEMKTRALWSKADGVWMVPFFCKDEHQGLNQKKFLLKYRGGRTKNKWRVLIFTITFVEKTTEKNEMAFVLPFVDYSRGCNTADLIQFVTDYEVYSIKHGNMLPIDDVDNLIRYEAGDKNSTPYFLLKNAPVASNASQASAAGGAQLSPGQLQGLLNGSPIKTPAAPIKKVAAPRSEPYDFLPGFSTDSGQTGFLIKNVSNASIEVIRTQLRATHRTISPGSALLFDAGGNVSFEIRYMIQGRRISRTYDADGNLIASKGN